MEQDEVKRIEAILFTTGRFMDINEISTLLGIGSPGVVKELLMKLKDEYEKRDSSLGLQELDGKFKLNIKKEYGYLANRIVSDKEMDSPTTKTLAVIAFKNPVTQSEVIKIRGNKAYDHVHFLLEQSLISSEKQGRTRLLKLTQRFYDYFDTAEKQVKEVFDKVKQEGEQGKDLSLDNMGENKEVKPENPVQVEQKV